MLQWIKQISSTSAFRTFSSDRSLQIHSLLSGLPEATQYLTNIQCELYKETYSARLVYFVVYGLVNNLIHYYQLHNSQSPSGVVYKAGLQQIFSLSEKGFSMLLESVPTCYAQALEKALLG
jgi:hypothetical protein